MRFSRYSHKAVVYNGVAFGIVLLMVLTAFYFRADKTADLVGMNDSQSSNDIYSINKMHGSSMEQYGLYEGVETKTIHNKTCLPGDFCDFECLVNKCRLDGEVAGDINLVKRLISVEDGCYWFEGNPEPWLQDGKLVNSFDSRVFGCLEEDEFRMVGVVEIYRSS